MVSFGMTADQNLLIGFYAVQISAVFVVAAAVVERLLDLLEIDAWKSKQDFVVVVVVVVDIEMDCNIYY